MIAQTKSTNPNDKARQKNDDFNVIRANSQPVGRKKKNIYAS